MALLFLSKITFLFKNIGWLGNSMFISALMFNTSFLTRNRNKLGHVPLIEYNSERIKKYICHNLINKKIINIVLSTSGTQSMFIHQFPVNILFFSSFQIQDAGFEILAHEERTLSEMEAQKFYQHKATEVV